MATPDSYRYAVGADIGSTNMRAALVRSDGQIVHLLRERVRPFDLGDFEPRLTQLADLLRALLSAPEAAGCPVEAIGVGSAGQVDPRGNIFGHNGPPEIKVFLPVRSRLQELLGTRLPIFVDNDSKCAAWGEYRFGAGRGSRNMICLTVGTGVGGGVVVDGKLVPGVKGVAGHVGFIVVDWNGPLSNSGVPGCVEDYASGTAIGAEARRALRAGRQSLILELAGGDVERVTSNEVFDAQKQGDPLAEEIIQRAARALGIAITSLIHTLNPELVVISGGVADRGEVFLAPVRETVRRCAMLNFRDTPIVPATLGNLAGVVGAAALCGF